MRLTNHIANRFMNPKDVEFLDEGMTLIVGKDWLEKPVEEVANIYNLLHPDQMAKQQPHKIYYVTDSVMDKLDMLRVKKKGNHFDYTVFKHVPPTKSTFIFKDNSCLRILWNGNQLTFLHLHFTFDADPVRKKKGYGQSLYVYYFADPNTGELAEHFDHKDVAQNEEWIYKLMCFIYLSENTEEILKPEQSKGTQKTGKVLNELPYPLILVTSKWNVTSIRTEGFGVSGHFRIQGTGAGRSIPKMIFIEPFEKHGYIRRAKNPNDEINP